MDEKRPREPAAIHDDGQADENWTACYPDRLRIEQKDDERRVHVVLLPSERSSVEESAKELRQRKIRSLMATVVCDPQPSPTSPNNTTHPTNTTTMHSAQDLSSPHNSLLGSEETTATEGMPSHRHIMHHPSMPNLVVGSQAAPESGAWLDRKPSNSSSSAASYSTAPDRPALRDATDDQRLAPEVLDTPEESASPALTSKSAPFPRNLPRSHASQASLLARTSRSMLLNLDPEEQRLLQIVHTGKKRFNLSPKKGIQYLVESGYFSSAQPSPHEIAHFLFHESEMLSKRMIGEYLGENAPFPLQVLHEYVQMQSYSGLPFDQALRLFLGTFRLPGEAQKIDRMMEKFARRYLECNPNDPLFTDPDTAYILAFSIIMLNTDLHNPAVKNKIRKEAFVRNNLDVLMKSRRASAANCSKSPTAAATATPSTTANTTTTKSISRTYLESIYDAIRATPLKLHAFDDDPLNNNPFYYTFFNPEREGWVIKLGGRIKTWKKRYCILTGSCLYYFKQDTSGGSKSASTSNSTSTATSPAGLSDPDSPVPPDISQKPCGIIPLENLGVAPVDYQQVAGALGGSSYRKRFFFRLYALHPNEEGIEESTASISPTAPISAVRSSPQQPDSGQCSSPLSDRSNVPPSVDSSPVSSLFSSPTQPRLSLSSRPQSPLSPMNQQQQQQQQRIMRPGSSQSSASKHHRPTIKAAKTTSDGKIVEGKHSEYIFGCRTADERDDWMNSLRAQMAQPPVYILYQERRKAAQQKGDLRRGLAEKPEATSGGGGDGDSPVE